MVLSGSLVGVENFGEALEDIRGAFDPEHLLVAAIFIEAAFLGKVRADMNELLECEVDRSKALQQPDGFCFPAEILLDQIEQESSSMNGSLLLRLCGLPEGIGFAGAVQAGIQSG